jgi:hypothetical protein
LSVAFELEKSELVALELMELTVEALELEVSTLEVYVITVVEILDVGETYVLEDNVVASPSTVEVMSEVLVLPGTESVELDVVLTIVVDSIEPICELLMVEVVMSLVTMDEADSPELVGDVEIAEVITVVEMLDVGGTYELDVIFEVSTSDVNVLINVLMLPGLVAIVLDVIMVIESVPLVGEV